MAAKKGAAKAAAPVAVAEEAAATAETGAITPPASEGGPEISAAGTGAEAEAAKAAAEAEKAAAEAAETAQAAGTAATDAEQSPAPPDAPSLMVIGPVAVLPLVGGGERYVYRGAPVGDNYTEAGIKHAQAVGLVGLPK